MKLMDYQNMRGGRVVLQDVCKPQVFIVTSLLKLTLAELTLNVHLCLGAVQKGRHHFFPVF